MHGTKQACDCVSRGETKRREGHVSKVEEVVEAEAGLQAQAEVAEQQAVPYENAVASRTEYMTPDLGPEVPAPRGPHAALNVLASEFAGMLVSECLALP